MLKTTHHTLTAIVFLCQCGAPHAAEVNLNGVVGARALVVIDGGKPRWLATGETSPEGVKLISVQGESAVIEAGGKREMLTLGQSARLSGTPQGSGAQSVTLVADGRGHFVTTGAINGITVRMLVDTGASLVSMSNIEARRLGIDYATGQRASVSTANGIVPAFRVKLNEVRIGAVTLTNVDGLVHVGNDLPIILLGMSFLNRMEMRRDGEKMVLTKRF